ncbi:hypothetical protein DFAR_2210032 [Desulfarculales bacterium]
MILTLLWEECKAVHALGYQYRWFYERYRGWSGKLGPVMRQKHRAGEKTFIDYVGQTVDVVSLWRVRLGRPRSSWWF